MAEQILNLAQTQAAFEQMGGKTVAEGVDRDFFLMPHSLTSTFMATCVLPRFIWVVACRTVSSEPRALGNRK